MAPGLPNVPGAGAAAPRRLLAVQSIGVEWLRRLLLTPPYSRRCSMAQTYTGMQLLQEFFSSGPTGRRVTMEELKKLTKEDREEMVTDIARQRGLKKYTDPATNQPAYS